MADLKLVGLVLFHLLCVGLPIAAAVLTADRIGVRRIAVVLALALAASGVLAYLTFWAYYWCRLPGETCSYLIVAGSILLIAWCLWTRNPGRDRICALGTPLALWALGSAFLIFFGFMYGGTHTAIAVGGMRFSSPMPSDNDIPAFFTEWFFLNGHHGTPAEFPGGWLASDRPPLQIGYALQQRPWIWNGNGLDYQIVGVLVQQLWIIGGGRGSGRPTLVETSSSSEIRIFAGVDGARLDWYARVIAEGETWQNADDKRARTGRHPGESDGDSRSASPVSSPWGSSSPSSWPRARRPRAAPPKPRPWTASCSPSPAGSAGRSTRMRARGSAGTSPTTKGSAAEAGTSPRGAKSKDRTSKWRQNSGDCGRKRPMRSVWWQRAKGRRPPARR